MLMSPPVVAAVLFGAVLHAGWNVAVRAGGDRKAETVLLVGGATLIAVVVLPFLPQPHAAAWRYLLVSAVAQTAYFVLIAEAYARGGITLVYPLMRGVAPMLTLFAAWLLLGEMLPTAAWLGVAVICCGVMLQARGRGDAAETSAIRLALANAVVISCYTLIDAVGARVSGAPVAYTLWLFPLAALPTMVWLHWRTPPRWPSMRAALRGVGGGASSIGAYALTLWAMTHAPVAPVAALRESSMLFALVLARIFLGERPARRGWAAVATIAAGAAILRLA
jgi:drug/metabolite transporter (DMT)-like permease